MILRRNANAKTFKKRKRKEEAAAANLDDNIMHPEYHTNGHLD
jgi:hypothetical protein